MTDPLSLFPRPALVIDDALDVLAANAAAAAVLGGEGDDCGSLTARLAALSVGDELALATARLVTPGESESLEWREGEAQYEVDVSRAEGDDARFYVFFHDVTEARQTERIHLNARAWLESILADIPLGIAVLDARGGIRFVNRAMQNFARRLTGRGELVDVIGGSVAALAPEETGTRWQQLCSEAMAQRQAAEGERETLLEGDLVVATEAHPLHDHRGELTGAILVVDDVTVQARLESELIRMEKLATVGQMVITVNHEINNPLVIISTNAQSLRLLNKDLDDKSRTKIERIETAVKRISEVTERLRTMDEVVSSEYIADGPAMVDVWGTPGGAEAASDEEAKP